MTGSAADRPLLRRLAAAFEHADPVPPATLAAARRAGILAGRSRGWRALALVADGCAGPVGPGLRGGRRDVLGFADHQVRVDLELRTEDSLVRVTGLVTGTGELPAVLVRWPAGVELAERAAVVDEFGRFSVAALPAGPLGVVVRRAGQPDAVSLWFVA